MNVSHETSPGNNPNCIYKYWYVYHNVSHETLPSMFKVYWRDCAENVSCETFHIFFICIEMFNEKPAALIKIAMSMLFCEDVSHETFPSLNI